MKKILFLSTLIVGALALNSCNNTPDFPGLEDKTQIPHVVKYVTTYAGATFSEDKPAKDVLPEWLYGKYYTADKGSTAMVNYKFTVSTPEYIKALGSTKPYTLTAENYQEVWGDGSTLNYFSPSKPASNFLPTILGQAMTEPAEGDLVAVTYNEADRDGGEPAFKDDFESKTLDAWKNVYMVNDKAWASKTYNNNNFYAEISAYKYDVGDKKVDTYLITANPITITNGLVFSFDAAYRNIKGDAGVEVFIGTNLTDFTIAGVNAATWDNVTDKFTFDKTTGEFADAGSYAMDDYDGKQVYIAFRYTGDNGNAATTTVRVDNVVVKEAALIPVESAPKTALYQYTEGAWKAYKDAYVLQPEDYTAMGVDNFTSTIAQAHLPMFLAQKYPLAIAGTIKAVVFKLSDTTFMALEFQKEATGWTLTGGTTDLTDEYEFDGSKWVYVRTVPKAALNETFEGRSYTEKEKTIVEDWLNVTLKGEDFWRDRQYSKNTYTEGVAYGSKTEGEIELWLITPPLEIKNDYILTFDMVSGHWTHDALQVYVSSSFSGKEEDLAQSIEDNQWTEIVDGFDFPRREGGYSPFTNVGSSSLNSYAGQTIYVAFKYWGNKLEGKTSTIQLDNIYVGE